MNVTEKTLGVLEFVIVSPKLNPYTLETKELKSFWLNHWGVTFEKSGSPDETWKQHFDEQDLVVGLRSDGVFISCHLYTFYDLNSSSIFETEYFSYFRPETIGAMRFRKLVKVMTLEYLGVSPSFTRNREKISVGKLMAVLCTYVAEVLGKDAVIGTPISSTKVEEMMTNVGGVTLEREIKKYGYELCFGYMPTQPRVLSSEIYLRDLAEGIWASRKDLSLMTRDESVSRVKSA
ncbi:MAG: hypothetical protein EOP06_00300 [Proteobacteria bacterium]|nr:MAG: hypothetical protein EOP06_00300 [Pseudomonadota bacterium]